MEIKEQIHGLTDEMLTNLGRLVAIDSQLGTPAEGMPFGEGPAKVLEEALKIADELGFKTVNLDNYCGYAEMGEGEEMINEVVDVYADWKEKGGTRREYLERIADIEGIYVPSFYDVEYNDDGTVKSITPNNPHAKAVIRKRIMADFDKTEAPESIIVPYGEVVHDRVMLEVFRGCIRGCRFCQAGYIYRPVRERKPETLTCLADRLLKSSGYDEISLSSLSTSDYTGLKEPRKRRLVCHCRL